MRGVQLRLVLLLFLASLAPAMPGAAAAQNFRAELSGKNQVPKIRTPATGVLKLALSGKELTFVLSTERITRPTAAHIHKGKKDENGPPIASLFGGPVKPGTFGGILSQGTIRESNLLGELEGKTVADLVRLMQSGETYVNVHTETYPAGEIRGQIRAR